MTLHNICVFLRLQHGYDCELAKGIARYARTRPQWRLFVWPNSNNTLNAPRGRHCDAAIALTEGPAPDLATKVPLVLIGTGSKPGACVVSPDQRAIGRLAAEHFHASGFRRFICYSGTKPWATEREAGFWETVAALGCERIDCPLTYSHRLDVDWTDAANSLATWLATVPGPLGLLGVNDNAARVACEACHIAGLRVPEQVGIIGVDNDLTLCELSNTPLSSVDPATDQIGFVAAQTLDRWLTAGYRPNEPILVPPRGVVRRRSTDVVAIEDEAVAAAAHFVRDRFFEQITVDDVADAACLSQSALQRRFKAAMGRTVHQEMTRLRVQHACELLQSTDDSLDHIAITAGFGSLPYFHRVFKRHLGQTPGNYRKSERASTLKEPVREAPAV